MRFDVVTELRDGAIHFSAALCYSLVGLLLFGRENYVRRGGRGAPVANGMRSVLDRMRAWFQGNF